MLTKPSNWLSPINRSAYRTATNADRMWTGKLSLGCRRITSGHEGDPYDPGATESLVDTGFGRITQYARELFETDYSQYVSLPSCFLTRQVFFITALSILLESSLFYVWSSKNK